MHSRKVNDKKATTFKYRLVWSTVYSLVDTKLFLITAFNSLEEPQIADTDFMVTNHSGQFSWLINIRYCKKVVLETGISESQNTIKNTKFYSNVFFHGWRKMESTKNKWAESAAALLSDILLGL